MNQQHFKVNQFAKALIDTAWWTLHSAITDTPLHELIGAQRDAIPVGADFGVMDSIDDLLSSIENAANENFPRVKLKFRPGWDLPMIRAVREAFPELPFHIDCNSGYRLSDLALFQELDEYNLVMFEQPLNHDDVVDHASLQAAVMTPVCLDESISSLQMAKQAIALGSCKYVNIKPGRVGGLVRQSPFTTYVQSMASRAGSAECLRVQLAARYAPHSQRSQTSPMPLTSSRVVDTTQQI